MDVIYLMYATAFVLGFLVGRVTLPKSYVYHNENQNDKQTKASAKEKRKAIVIDDKKFVTDVSTNTLEKKGVDLGAKVVADDDVQSSVIKLSQFKKNK